MRRKKTRRRRENEGLDAIIALAFLPTLIFEHDLVRVRADMETEGYSLKAGMAGTVVSVYRGGRGYAVEFSDLERGWVVVAVGRDEVEVAKPNAID